MLPFHDSAAFCSYGYHFPPLMRPFGMTYPYPAWPIYQDTSVCALADTMASLYITPPPIQHQLAAPHVQTPPRSDDLPDAAPLTLSRSISTNMPDAAPFASSLKKPSDLMSDMLVYALYPTMYLPVEPKSEYSYSPHGTKKLKTQALVNKRITSAPWMKVGRLLEFPHAVVIETLQITDGFIKCSLGKKALEIAGHFFKHRQEQSTTTYEHLKKLATDLKGTCLGQSMAMIIAYAKVEEVNAVKLLDTINKTHVLFFQLVEQMSYESNRPTLRYRDGTFSVGFIEIIQNKSMATVEEISGLKYKGTKIFDLNRRGSIAEITDLFLKTPNSLVEIGLYHNLGVGDHSMLAFLTKESAIYDSALGFAHFSTREGMVNDMKRLIFSKQASARCLRAVTLQFFSKD
jgi:hypothetical protein